MCKLSILISDPYIRIQGHRMFFPASHGLKNEAITPPYDLCSEQQCKMKPHHQRNRLEFPIRHKQFPGRYVSKGFCKIIMHSPLICNREVGDRHLRMGLKPQLKRGYLPDSPWVRSLCCVGPRRKKQRRPRTKPGQSLAVLVSERPGQTSRVPGKGDCRFSAKGCHSLG